VHLEANLTRLGRTTKHEAKPKLDVLKLGSK
jgi:hypothetical protein